jgi:YidC/Oxa1 family membrane protein insertase
VSDNRNLILAIVLSALVLFGWSLLTETYFPTANEPSTKVVEGKQVPVAKPAEDPTADSPVAIRDRRLVLAETPRLPIVTPSLRGSINLRGARLDDLVLTRHTQDMRPGSPPVRLLSPAGAPASYFAQFGWTGEGIALPGPNTVWTATGNRLAPGRPVRLSWDNGRGQLFAIDLSVDENYMFTARQSVANRTGGAVAVRPYSLVNRAQPSPDPDSWTLHIGPVGVFNGAADYETGFDNLVENSVRRVSTTGGWLGFSDKYWLTAVVPDQQASLEATFRRTNQGGFQADATPAPAIVGPGRTATYQSRFFAGAKEIRLLDRYADQAGVPLFERAIDWGWFRWFMKPIFYLLDFLFGAIGNFGVAIIMLTIIVRALMFPIAQRQFKSMAAMRVVQPKMKVIQERFKDDKQRQQQEMLKLYQEEKINPLAGCLPILIQIPIWYALYKVLLIAVEMRHQPFVGWIKDLAAPDPLTPVNLFGFLDFAPPAFLAIGILPIVVGITMYLQFKLNPQPADPVQQQVFAIMPWVLMFVMAPFAAGLQLYWATSNILTILQQKWLYSRYPGMKAATETPAT